MEREEEKLNLKKSKTNGEMYEIRTLEMRKK